MKKFLLSLAGAFALTGTLPADPYVHDDGLTSTFAEGAGSLEWNGRNSVTYFIQVKTGEELTDSWIYAPLVTPGLGEETGWGFTSTAGQGWFRIAFTEIPTTEPYLADPDGDTLGNLLEVSILCLDPLVANAWVDTDLDGIHDAIEDHWFEDLTTTDGTGDVNADGIRDAFQLQAAQDPMVDPSADTEMRANYVYDSMGRLTQVSGKETVTITPDVEGNIQNIQ